MVFRRFFHACIFWLGCWCSLSLYGDVLVRALPAQPVSLDPHRFLGTPEASVLKDLYEGLTVQDKNGEPSPGAAERWEVSDDGLRWTFHLRPDLRWSDGSVLTSEDFLYSFRRLAYPATRAQYRWYLDLATITNSREIAAGAMAPDALGVSAPDAQTLVITLDEPRVWLPALLTFPAFLPVSSNAIEGCGPLWAELEGCAVSNGPYRYVTGAGKEWLLGQNSFYHDRVDRAPEEVVWRAYDSILDEIVAFRQGELDISSAIPAELGVHIK